MHLIDRSGHFHHGANEGMAQWPQLGRETQKETTAMGLKSHTGLCSTSWAHGLSRHFLRLVTRPASTLVSPSACCKVVGSQRMSLGVYGSYLYHGPLVGRSWPGSRPPGSRRRASLGVGAHERVQPHVTLKGRPLVEDLDEEEVQEGGAVSAFV